MDTPKERITTGHDYYQEVVDLLARHDIDTSMWGTGAAKSVSELAQEITEGESILVDDEAGLTRVVKGIGMDVFAEVNGERYILVEDRQELANGTIKRRELSTSLGEKTKIGESLNDVIARALAEELGIDISDAAVDITDHTTIGEHQSASYPGLATLTILRYVRVCIGPSQFVAEGYVELQPSKSVHFVWQHLGARGNNIFSHEVK